MPEHSFGGGWTEVKLGGLRQYLLAYQKIFHANTRARFFSTWYVDAFAGTGSRFSAAEPDLFNDVYEDQDAVRYHEGSAKIALGLPQPFHRYLFIEKSRRRIDDLRSAVAAEQPHLLNNCEFKPGDANAEIKTWCGQRDWDKERAVVFLDPYGMQVEWSTIECLAATGGVDLWYLFPLGIGVVRLLTRDGVIDESWQRRLDLLFGTNAWRSEFYTEATTPSLFGEDLTTVQRDASTTKITAFIQQRLQNIFAGVANGRILYNSRSSPLYLFCFAASNKKGASTALRIAQHVLKA